MAAIGLQGRMSARQSCHLLPLSSRSAFAARAPSGAARARRARRCPRRGRACAAGRRRRRLQSGMWTSCPPRRLRRGLGRPFRTDGKKDNRDMSPGSGREHALETTAPPFGNTAPAREGPERTAKHRRLLAKYRGRAKMYCESDFWNCSPLFLDRRRRFWNSSPLVMDRKCTADDPESLVMDRRLLFLDQERAIDNPSRAAGNRKSLADDPSRAVIDSRRLFHDSKSTVRDSGSLALHRECLAHDSWRSFPDSGRESRFSSSLAHLIFFVTRPRHEEKTPSS
jgi:hypothetical protein